MLVIIAVVFVATAVEGYCDMDNVYFGYMVDWQKELGNEDYQS